jgi:hypothetical protein
MGRGAELGRQPFPQVLSLFGVVSLTGTEGVGSATLQLHSSYRQQQRRQLHGWASNQGRQWVLGVHCQIILVRAVHALYGGPARVTRDVTCLRGCTPCAQLHAMPPSAPHCLPTSYSCSSPLGLLQRCLLAQRRACSVQAPCCLGAVPSAVAATAAAEGGL